MNDKLLERFTLGRKSEPEAAAPAHPEEAETLDLGNFGILRGPAERAVMLELRKADGTILAVGYAWLARIEFDPSEGIRLFGGDWEVAIAGRNLNREVRPNVRLFESLARHRVPWLREANEREQMQKGSATVIERVVWRCLQR
jgi:hypothetical protein